MDAPANWVNHSRADGPRKGRLDTPIGVGVEHVDILVARHSTGQRTVQADVIPVFRNLLFYSLTQRAEERNS